MRLSHFERFAPRCPICVTRRTEPQGVEGAPRLLLVERLATHGAGDTAQVVHGVLRCADRACQAEFPIIDGIPFILASARELIAASSAAILLRDDVPVRLVALVTDCAGPGSWLDRAWLYAGSYAADHYGTGQPDGAPSAAGSNAALDPAGWTPGSAASVLDRLLALAGEHGSAVGDALDAGCATGGVSLALAQRLPNALVLGIDTNPSMLRVAHGVLRTGAARFPLRVEGIAYEPRVARLSADAVEASARVDAWCCDALALPVERGTFAACVALHTLDSVAAPAGLLMELARLTRPGGRVMIASPFDWSPAVTSIDHWLGGHSQAASHGARGDRVLAQVLTGPDDPATHPGLASLRVLARDDIAWRVRLHARAMTTYTTHCVACEVVDVSRPA